MATARHEATANLLSNGKVLIAGGYNNSDTLSTAELYDPATGSFTPTGSMVTGRVWHTATLMPNGKVLIAGGRNQISVPLSSAEVYDPGPGGMGIFTPTSGFMGIARLGHTATLLPNGKVLIAGGRNDASAHSSAELYDPATGFFTPTIQRMRTPRHDHTPTLLPNGRVLIAGGWDSSGSVYASYSSTEIYDPVTGFFAVSGSMDIARYVHRATLLSNGKVLITGGYNLTDGGLASY